MIKFNEWVLREQGPEQAQQMQFKVGGNLGNTSGGVSQFGRRVQVAANNIPNGRNINALWQAIKALYGNMPPDELVKTFENDWRTLKQKILPSFKAASQQGQSSLS